MARVGWRLVQGQAHRLAINGQVVAHVEQAFVDVRPQVEQFIVGKGTEDVQFQDGKIRRPIDAGRQVPDVDVQRSGKDFQG
ncbi:hypothetical protein D3C73_1266750 [compost metagenome]